MYNYKIWIQYNVDTNGATAKKEKWYSTNDTNAIIIHIYRDRIYKLK
jgi:hypothetical protein